MPGQHSDELDSPTIVQPLRILKAASPPPQNGDNHPFAPPPMRSIEDDFQRFRDSIESQNSKRDTLPKHLSVQSDPDEGLFKIKPQRRDSEQAAAAAQPEPAAPQRNQMNQLDQFPQPSQQQWPRANGSSSSCAIHAPTPRGGLSHSVSTSTTRGQRGSPPPPETPAFDVGEGPGSIEARYAASGISGSGTLSGLSAAAALRAAAMQNASQAQATPYSANKVPTLGQPRLPTHRESYASNDSAEAGPHGSLPSVPLPNQRIPGQVPQQNTMQYKEENPEQIKFSGLSLEESQDAPPAYESIAPGGGPTVDEKGKEKQPMPQSNGVGRSDSAMQAPGHPAFERERPGRGLSVRVPSLKIATEQYSNTAGYETYQSNTAAPPPLPEGWMAHLDPTSGQYYYIHLATQSTQWEFPKGLNPLNTVSEKTGFATQTGFVPQAAYGPASPTFPPGGVISPVLNSFPSNPFGALPQTTIFNIQPTNSVYFGPYLKYTNMDVERGVWIGSIMLITDGPQPPTIHIHQTVDLSPNPHQLKANPIHSHQKWTFYKYDIELQMDDEGPAKWTYAITSHLGCTRYEFLVAGRYEHNWRFFAHSGNDFAMNVPEATRVQLGVDTMWRDALQKHTEIGGFHCQLGLGNQVYCDRIWKDIPLLKEWLSISGKENRKNAFWTPRHDEDVLHAYFHYYTSHLDQPTIRDVFAQIPYVFTINDREIFDGYGSFPEHMQASNIFKNVSRIAIDWYLLFQHHTTTEMLRNPASNRDLFSITGQGWHFIKQLGPSVVVVGPDCRSERTPNQVLSGSTYQSLFPKIATLPPTVQHCIWMIPVPLLYPRMDTVEQLAQVAATGKKAVTGAYNMVGKVAGNIAGVVGAKGMVNDSFSAVKGFVGKQGLMNGMVTQFGEVDMVDSLRDLWTHDSKDLERTYLIRMLQDISLQRGIRMTFLSGDVNACGAGLFHDPLRPNDHKTMYQIISSSIINAPPPPHVIKMLHNNKAPYVPVNGQKSSYMPSDTKEDMMEIFQADVTGQPREHKRLMGRRNYVAIIVFDQDELQQYHGHYAPEKSGPPQPNLSLAIDFLVQGEGMAPQPVKYGPVVIPKLEYGA